MEVGGSKAKDCFNMGSYVFEANFYGQGIFSGSLNSVEAKAVVWAKGLVFLKPGILHIEEWNMFFNPTTQKPKSAQDWIQLYNLN